MMNNRNEHYLIPTSNKDLQQQHHGKDKEQEQDDGQDVNNDVVDHGYDDHVEEDEEGDNVVVVNNGEDDNKTDHHHYMQLGYSPFHHAVHNNSNDCDDDDDHYTEDDNGKDSQEFTRITMLQPQQLLLQVGGSSSVVLVQDDDIITTPGTGTTTTTTNTAPTTTTTADNYHLYTCIANPPFYYKHYNDNQIDSDYYDETQSHEEIFYADGSSSCRQEVSQQQDNDDQHDSGNDVVVHDGDDEYTTTQQNVDNTHDGILLDFHSLAQQALQSLDSEYFNTVMPSVGGNISTVSRRGQKGSCFDCFEIDNGKDGNDDDDRLRRIQEENVETVTTDSHLLTTTTKQELQQQTVQTTLLDTAAISKAMNNIALSCHSIQEKFSKWKPSHCSYTPFSVPSLHPIIPHKALLAFQRLTKKAQFTTANWTRSATLAEAISRIFLGKEMDCVLHDPQEQEQEQGQHQDDLYFVIHCIGADHVECQSRENIVNMFQPIVKWIHGYQPNLFQEKGTKQQENTSSFEAAKHLRIELLGPNVPLHSQDFGVMNLLPNNVPGKLESATVICKNCMYHDYIVEMMTQENKKKKKKNRHGHGHYHYPSMIIAYNAGIWGYTDWHPTLKSLCNMNIMTRPVPFVITAYTIYEAEDDAQVLDEVLQEEWKASTSHSDIMIPTAMDHAKSRCLWSAELNPYASRVVRETKSSDNIYHENGAWQAYLMGKITDVE